MTDLTQHAVPPEQDRASDTGWYLYGIVRRPARLGAVSSLGADVAEIQTIEHDDLAAVVRAVSMSDFDPATLQERANSMEWIEGTVRAHNDIIAALHAEQAVLPAKFGSVYGRREDIGNALAAARDALLERLETVHDRDEWAVHLFANAEQMERWAGGEDETVAQLRQEVDAASPGRAYFLRQKLATEIAAGSERAANQRARKAHGQLEAHAVESRLSPSGPTPEGETEIVRAAYLVSRADEPAFLAAVASLEDREEGLRVEYSGPWPPYSFTEPTMEAAGT